MEGVLFGNFSEQEVRELDAHASDSLEFVWQREPCSPMANNSDSLKKLAGTPDKQRPPLGGVSPNIPPNPPTSPIEGVELDRAKSPIKLNINAIPFVPGGQPNIVPPKNHLSSVLNSTVQRLCTESCEEKSHETGCAAHEGKSGETGCTSNEGKSGETGSSAPERRSSEIVSTTKFDGRKPIQGHTNIGRDTSEADNSPIEVLVGTNNSGRSESVKDTEHFVEPSKPAPPTDVSTSTSQEKDSVFFTPTPTPHTTTPPPQPTPTSTSHSNSTSQSTVQSQSTTPVSQSSGATPMSRGTTPTSRGNSPNVQSPIVTTGAAPTRNAWGGKKSWASIFSSPSSTVSTSQQPSPLQPQSAKVTEGVATTGETQTAVDEKSRNAHLRELAEQLSRWRVSHAPVSIQPRGLVNQGNWCYMHAPLQALLFCPPFFNLFHSLNNSFPVLSRDPSPSPIVDTMVQFVQEFKPYPQATSGPVPAPDLKSKKKKSKVEFHHGDPFRPDCVYEMLRRIKSSFSVKGRQEDAEEFLGCVLDGLHEEMLSAQGVLDSAQQPVATETKGATSASSSDPCEGVEGVEWEQVGPKNKSAITRQTSFRDSPITEIFGGELRSSVHRQKAKESATLQPFFSLQLDIQSEDVWTVKDALEALSAKEKIDISESEAHKRLTLARLPPVLILHLKRFVFNKTGGSQKLLKQVQYSTELELGKDLLSPAIRTRLPPSHRSYRLWAVVYHHGKTATGGHYTCDVHHPVCGGWVRADDSLLKQVPEDHVLKPATGTQANKVAYILFYRRLDTISTL